MNSKALYIPILIDLTVITFFYAVVIMLKIVEIFEKLGIKNAHDVVIQTYSGSKLFDLYKLYHNFENMKGGTKEVKEFIKYKNVTFTFFKYIVGDVVHYALHPEENIDKMPQCVLIMIDTIHKCAIIHGITYHKDLKCFSKTQANSFGSELGGKFLLKLSFALIKEVKDHYNLKYITLTDNSRKLCESVNDLIDLDAFYMFTHGETWYGKYGFVPFNSSNEKTDKSVVSDYKYNQKIVKETLVKDTNIFKYIKRAIKKYKLNLKIDDLDKLEKKYNNLSIMKCIKDLVAKYDQNCTIFYYMYEKLMKDLNMKNLHGRPYWKKL